MKNIRSDAQAQAWEALCRKHYRLFKAGRLRMKGPADMAGQLVDVPADQPTQIRAWATTTAVDLEGDVVLPGGVDDSYFRLNRTLFVDHDYSAMSAIGKLRNLIAKPQGLICESVLIDNPANPLVAQIRALAAAGNIGQSIGFEAIDFGPPTPDEQQAFPGVRMVHRKWRLLEISYTAFPMNGTAQTDLTPAETAEPKTIVII
jgi:phage head maturation protease